MNKKECNMAPNKYYSNEIIRVIKTLDILSISIVEIVRTGKTIAIGSELIKESINTESYLSPELFYRRK